MKRYHGYGQYYIVKTTPAGKESKVYTTDSELWDRYQDGEASQAELRRKFSYAQ